MALKTVEEETSLCCNAEIEYRLVERDPLWGTELAGYYETIECKYCTDCGEEI